MDRPAHAFSLVELLVVLALIALLVGILIPILGGARDSARVVGCVSNLRQLGMAHAAYATDHDGAFVDAGLPHGAALDESVAWINTLSVYYGGASAEDVSQDQQRRRFDRVLRSPLDDSPHWMPSVGGGVPVEGSSPGDPRYRRSSYGLNNYLSRTYSPVVAIEGPFAAIRSVDEIPDPAGTVHFSVMAFRGPFAGADHVHVESWWQNPPVLAAAELQTNAAGGPPVDWTSRSNYLYVDGHVETATFADVYRPPYDRDGDGLVRAGDVVNRFDPETSFEVTRAAMFAGSEPEDG